MVCLWVVATLWLGVCHCGQLTDNDSLQGALEAINRRQRDLADSTIYYLDHIHSPKDGAVRIMYPRHGEGDGQPENIGYGYQKSLAPKTAGVFDTIAVSESELGSHDPGVESHPPAEGNDLANILLEYIEDNMGNSDGPNSQRYHYQNQNSGTKRSVFRERDVNNLPEALQNLYQEGEHSEQYLENGERPQVVPSSFRERFSSKPSRNYPVQNVQALVRNFGGLNRDTDSFSGNDEDSDEYLSMLNSVWEKYQDSKPDDFSPEDLSESDVEEILDFINKKEVTKRQHERSYETGYDFYNSPLAWVKRGRQQLNDNSKPSSDQFLHALKFLNSHHSDTLESLREEDVPDEERDADVAKLLMEEQEASKNNKQYTKRFWRGNTYDEHHKKAKRYPIAKRSSSYYTSPAVLYHKASSDSLSQRRKKNVKNHVSDGTTDPKIARELNDIFSSSDNPNKDKRVKNNTENTHSSQPQSKPDSTNITTIEQNSNKNSSRTYLEELSIEPIHGSHMHRKRSGQKEETSVDSQQKPLEMSKKSVDWSDYFGIDKRHKKSTNKAANDEWLLDQYLKAYSISAKAIENPEGSQNENSHLEMEKKSTDEMDAKLRAMEDMIVDQALKYTGAHEGMTDSEEVQAVKDRVISQLAAAYSLEKMRKALSEFKSSIAAQKATAPAHPTTHVPTDIPEQKDKRVAVKKEKAGMPPSANIEKKDVLDNSISALHSTGHSHPSSWGQEDACPILDDVEQRCKKIANMAHDSSEGLLQLCNVYQVCYLCGSEIGKAPYNCDMNFLLEANRLCQDSPRCRYSVHRTVAAMTVVHGEPFPHSCDWQNHPCLARFLALTMR